MRVTDMKKTPFSHLLILFLALGAGFAVLEMSLTSVPRAAYGRMMDAAARTEAAFEAIRQARYARGAEPDPLDDPNLTGLIGPEYTGITTSLGHLESKRSTTNPNVAAMIVDMFEDIGLAQGDRVAFNFSGSFPALNIAVRCAADAMGLEGVSIFSMGASTYGATDPAFTYGDMELLLYEQGLISTLSIAFSTGGEGDAGLDMMDEKSRDEVVKRLKGHYPYIWEPDAEANLQTRIVLYEAGGPLRCFVNVGGNMVAFGEDSNLYIAAGILRDLPRGERGRGLLPHYLGRGLPSINLLNMRGLLPQYGLPIDPVPLPGVGEGGVYERIALPHRLLVPGMLALTVIALLGINRMRKRSGQ